MTPAAIATARRLVAAPWWKRHPDGPLYVDDGVTNKRSVDGVRWIDIAAPDTRDYDWLPDLDDTGTAGRLVADLHQLAIARQLEIRISWEPDEGEWRVGACHEDDHTGGAAGYAPDLGHAVALALLAVHEQEK